MGWLEKARSRFLPILGLEKEKELSLWVDGIKCEKCVEKIESSLSDLQFVRVAQVTSRDPGRVRLLIREDASLEGVQASLQSILSNNGYRLSKILIEN
jgi:hypothetical protein